MRRIFAWMMCLCCLLGLATTAFAANASPSVSVSGSVTPSGTCQITVNVTIRLDEPVSSLNFPLGTDVSGVTLNGGSASTTTLSNGITAVKLNYLKNQTGTFPLTIHYTLNNVVITDEETGKQTVSIPLLAGFPYPIEKMTFAVTMPGEFTAKPVFYSGYHEQDIERSIQYGISGMVISGTVTSQLKDSETLRLTLEAPEGMFPRAQAVGGSLEFDSWAMGICMVLALGFWLATMGRLPIFPLPRSTAPEGFSAGLVGSFLGKRPADLTIMVIQWAQLGYLVIHLDDNGRVLLYKKMNMGNERSAFERRCFQHLFGKKQMIEATGYRYARLWESTAKQSQRFSCGYRKDSGNPLILRILSCIAGLFAGVALGDCLAATPAWRVILMMLFGVACALASWEIQQGMLCIRQMRKWDLCYGALCAGAMVAAGLLIPKGLYYALGAVVWNICAGLLIVFGGRRTENGRRLYAELTALRRYMRTTTKTDLARILRTNPNYYYDVAPFAYALGVDKRFARRFESLRIPACTWLLSGTAPARTPEEWYPLLRDTVKAMNALTNRPFWEKQSRR